MANNYEFALYIALADYLIRLSDVRKRWNNNGRVGKDGLGRRGARRGRTARSSGEEQLRARGTVA